VIRGAKEHLASRTEPKIILTDGEHRSVDDFMGDLLDVEADWIDDPISGYYFPAFVRWADVSAITWHHILPPPDLAGGDNPKHRVRAALSKTGSPMTVAELVAATDLAQSTISRALYELEAEGNVRRPRRKAGRADLWGVSGI
jgi:hypothetical protein